MEMPLVSVIIASKNRARYIGEAIESVLKQDYTSREIIVVDDASTDDTEKIVRSYSGVRFIAQAGTGIADAWNTGIRESRGELVAFIDTDDVWVPHKLRVQVEYLRVHPEIQYVVSRLKYFLQPGCAVPSNFKKNLLQGDYVGFLPQSLLARKWLFEKIGIFDTGLQFANDCEWFIRAKDGVSQWVLFRKCCCTSVCMRVILQTLARQ